LAAKFFHMHDARKNRNYEYKIFHLQY
jgi:hypothetical protein